MTIKILHQYNTTVS